MTHRSHPWLALFAALFGTVTIFAGGSVLLGPAREIAGQIVPFVLWFNTLAGLVYLAAAFGLWRGTTWAPRLAWAIAGATALIALAFAFAALTGTSFEPRTIAALALRTGIWGAIGWAAMRGARPA